MIAGDAKQSGGKFIAVSSVIDRKITRRARFAIAA
jgi:hypothetical protein